MTVMGFLCDLYHIKDLLIVVLTPILLLPLLIVGDSPEAKCAYVVAIMAIFWVTEALPIAVTSLLPVFMFPMVGLLSVKETSARYMNDTNMLFVGGLIMAAAIEHWNIHKRIALRILLFVGAEPRWLMLGMMAPTWFLSMWISNTATTAMMIPIANAILMQLKQTDKQFQQDKAIDNQAMELDDVELNMKQTTNGTNGTGTNGTTGTVTVGNEEKSEKEQQNFGDNIPDNVITEGDDPSFVRLCKCLTLSIAYAANVGGIGSLTGTGPNLVMKGQLDIVYEKYPDLESPITFASWMGFGVPTSLFLVIIVWIWLQILFLRCNGCCGKKDAERDIRVKAVIREQYEKLGPISFGQGAVVGHFVVLALLWITRDMGGEYGWGNLFIASYMKDAVPAMFIACSLFVFPSELPKIFCARVGVNRPPLKPLLSWKSAVDKVPWGVVFLLGGGFAMAYASQESGLSAWIGDKLIGLGGLEPWILNLVLCYIVAAMTEVTSNTATCTLMMPILAHLAYSIHQNPIYIMFPTAIATSFAFMLPVATPPNAVVFSYGYVKVIDMVIAGFLLNVICVLVLVGSTETLGNHLFDFHTIPDAILATYNSTI